MSVGHVLGYIGLVVVAWLYVVIVRPLNRAVEVHLERSRSQVPSEHEDPD